MTVRTVNLSGTYRIGAIGAARMGLVTPEVLNPQWLTGDLDGAGTTTVAQNVTFRRINYDQSVDLTGAYTVSAVSATEVTFAAPGATTTDWGRLAYYLGGQTRALSASVAVRETVWVGPFIVEDPNTAFLVVNVLALGGLFTDDGKTVRGIDVAFEVESTPVNQLDVPIGAAQTFVGTVSNFDGPGVKTSKAMKAKTLVCSLTIPGRQSVRIRRTTPADYSFKGTVTDEIKVQDLYGMGPVPQPDFGNVTTIRTRTFATQGALNVKERKLNCLATRRVPLWTGGTSFSADTATTDAAEIFVEICRNVLLGNRTLDEIDVASVHAAVDAARAYFGDPVAGQFNYTFDNDNTSFEEMAQSVATAVFCVPYRQGSQIKLMFERPTDDSVMLFNHRNKTPRSETRTVRFGPADDNDGVELEYTDAARDKPVTIYIPADRSAAKPRKITAYGVRNFKQAYWLAWRAFNKLRFQNQTSEFEAMQESAPLIRGERILVADNTRPDTQDGEVVAQAGLVLTLSQEVDLTNPAGYTIFLQLPDATVEAIPVTPGVETDQVILARAPRVALVLDPMFYARATYQLVPNVSARSSAFLLTDKHPQENGNYQLQAINYSSLYYQNDTLQLWMPFEEAGFLDHSAYERDGVGVGGATTVIDGTRGRVYSGAAGRSVTFPAFAPPAASYTKAVWLKRGDLVSNGGILESDVEFFGFTGANIVAGHGATPLAFAWPDAVNWHHATLVWDEPGDTMSLYLDGAFATAVSGGAVGPVAADQLIAFSGLVSRADDLRLINRALSPDEVLELYRATKL